LLPAKVLDLPQAPVASTAQMEAMHEAPDAISLHCIADILVWERQLGST
jgi:hypothetical protein